MHILLLLADNLYFVLVGAFYHIVHIQKREYIEQYDKSHKSHARKGNAVGKKLYYRRYKRNNGEKQYRYAHMLADTLVMLYNYRHIKDKYYQRYDIAYQKAC